MKISYLLLSFLFAAISISAQVNPQCPTISVEGPAGITPPGEQISFTATVKPTESTLTYKWTVSRGTISEGQGTPTIKVRVGPDDPDLTAKVEIGGLSQECLSNASETISDLTGNRPIAAKLDTFALPLNSISESRFQKIADAINNNPTSQTYILIPSDKAVRDALFARLNKIGLGDYDPPRITFVEMNGKNKIVEVWLVPPGATPPTKCESCNNSLLGRDSGNFTASASPNKKHKTLRPSKTAGCPLIAIVTPNKISMPGSILVFSARLTGKVPARAKYVWSVNAGKIISGQGTKVVRVRAPIGAGVSSIRAYLSISGLHLECNDSTTVVAGIADQPLVDPYDRYGDVSLEAEKTKLRSAFAVLGKYPKFKILIVKRSQTNSSLANKRINEIRSFIDNELKVVPSRYQIASLSGDESETVIWFVKPGTKVAALIGTK